METLTKLWLMLQKGFYSYENIDSWQTFNRTSLPDKKELYTNLTMEKITVAEYKYAKRVLEDFRKQNQGEYYKLYVQSATLLLSDVFESFYVRA